VTLRHDGDGRVVKRVELESGFSTSKYFLNSTALGGRVITELGGTGQKSKGYVYAGAEVIAEQEGNSVKWLHTNPVTGSRGASFGDGSFTREAEPDPSGADVGTENPFTGTPPPPPDPERPTVQRGAGGGAICYTQGFIIDCAQAGFFSALAGLGSHEGASGMMSGGGLGLTSSGFGDPRTIDGFCSTPLVDCNPAFLDWVYRKGYGNRPSELMYDAGFNQEFWGDSKRSDCADTVDDLVKRAQDHEPIYIADRAAMRIGQKMAMKARTGYSYGFRGGRNNNSLGTTGFRADLIRHGQGADVYLHLYGMAGAVLIGEFKVGTIIDGLPVPRFGGDRNRELNMTGYEVAQAQLDLDIAERDGGKLEAIAEVNDDVAAIDVASNMREFLKGRIDKSTLRDLIFKQLCDY
jgi:hypothetical protein